MRPGPDQIIACPHCDALARHFTLMSGNTFGARIYSDGKRVAPMLPRPPAVVRCAECSRFYWLADAREVSTLPTDGEGTPANPAWNTAKRIEEPAEEEYFVALATGLAKDREQERYLRLLAWWRGNDVYRDGKTAQPLPTGARRENLEALSHLLDAADAEGQIMKAEVFRQLGAFKPAMELLNVVTQGGLAGVVAQIREGCERGETGVKMLRM